MAKGMKYLTGSWENCNKIGQNFSGKKKKKKAPGW